MKFDLKRIFKIRGRKRGEVEAPVPSFEEAEASLRLSKVEQELIRLVLKAVEKAEKKGVIHGGEAEKLNAKYRGELGRVEEETGRSVKLLKLLELGRVRDNLHIGYLERIKAVEDAMKEIAASVGEEASVLLKPPKPSPSSKAKGGASKPRGLEPLKKEILKVMKKLEEMDEEG